MLGPLSVTAPTGQPYLYHYRWRFLCVLRLLYIYYIYIYILGVPLLEHRKAGRPPPPFHKTFRMFGGPEFHRPPAGMFGDEKSVILLLKFAAARNGLGTSQIWTIREKGDPKWRCRGFRVVPCRGSRCWGHGGHVHLHPEK